MAPAKVEDDPVTAEYDVFITPQMQEQIYLLQYVNRTRERPYNERYGARPEEMRIKPKSGYLEADVSLNPDFNFNRYRSLKWGDAMQTAKKLHNESATYGLASGFSQPRTRTTGRNNLKDKADRELQISNDLGTFRAAQDESRVLRSQTLGGQLVRHDDYAHGAQPIYFLGAFQGNQLHLSKVDGTVQMRPQFHHVDAEEQRTRIANSRTGPDEARTAPAARSVQQAYKDMGGDEKDKDAPERMMRRQLQDAEEESWVPLDYVDEAEEEAFAMFHDRMFVHEVDRVPRLKSAMDGEQFLDAISAPRRESPTRRRKRSNRKKEILDIDDEEQG